MVESNKKDIKKNYSVTSEIGLLSLRQEFTKSVG